MKIPFKKHPLSKIEDYPFRYSRCVQPKINKDRHVINIIAKELNHTDKNYTPTYQLLKSIDKGYGIGDPLCDAWIDHAITHKLPAHGMLMFNEVLEAGSRALTAGTLANNQPIPQPLKDLFAHATEKPAWHDDTKILLACLTLARYPFQQGLVLQSISLMGGYCVPALAEPLLATGQLTDNVVGRIARTLCFLAAVTIPQGLEHNEDNQQWEMGLKQTLKTRVVHGLVRHKLIDNQYANPWNTAKFGVPINQSDMLATNMSFSLTVIHGLSALKCDLSTAEKEAILHLWRYVAHIIGIDDTLVPKTERACNQWLYSYLVTQKFDALPASRLATALHELPILIETSNFKGVAKVEQKLRAGITRSYWGDDICDELGLPKPTLVGAGVFGVSKLQFVMEKLQESSPLTEQLMMKSAANYRNVVKDKYLTSNPEIEPLFDDIFELAMRSRWK